MNFGRILSTARVLLKSELFVKLQNPSWQTFEKIQTYTVMSLELTTILNILI